MIHSDKKIALAMYVSGYRHGDTEFYREQLMHDILADIVELPDNKYILGTSVYTVFSEYEANQTETVKGMLVSNGEVEVAGSGVYLISQYASADLY